MRNQGYELEERLSMEINASGFASFRKLDNSIVKIPVSGRVLTGGKTTRNKWDILVTPAYRLQVKSTSSNRSSVVNMVPVRNLFKLSERELLDVKPALDVMSYLMEEKVSSVKLSELSDKEDWREILTYLLFEGTPTAQEVPALQANYLVEIGNEGAVLIEKSEAVDYIWKSLTAEIKYRKGKTEPCLHVRYGR